MEKNKIIWNRGLAKLVEEASLKHYNTMFSHSGKIQPDNSLRVSEYVTFDSVFQVMLLKENYKKHYKSSIMEMLHDPNISEKHNSARHMEGAIDFAKSSSNINVSVTTERCKKVKSIFLRSTEYSSISIVPMDRLYYIIHSSVIYISVYRYPKVRSFCYSIQ